MAQPSRWSAVVAVAVALLATDVHAQAPSAGDSLDNQYASEQFLKELLCEGRTVESACGVDIKGAPMVCIEAERCGYVTPCRVCARTQLPGQADTARVPKLVRLPETNAQRSARGAHERAAIRWRQLALLGLLIAAVGLILVGYWFVRHKRTRHYAWATLIVGVIVAGVGRWRYQVAARAHTELLVQIEKERVVRLLPFATLDPLPRDHWHHPQYLEYQAQLDRMKRELEARGVDWRKRAREANEEPKAY